MCFLQEKGTAKSLRTEKKLCKYLQKLSILAFSLSCSLKQKEKIKSAVFKFPQSETIKIIKRKEKENFKWIKKKRRKRRKKLLSLFDAKLQNKFDDFQVKKLLLVLRIVVAAACLCCLLKIFSTRERKGVQKLIWKEKHKEKEK